MTKAAGIILKNNKNEILFILRDDKPDIFWPNTWALPGGGVEDGEEPKEGCIRETEEETGYKLTDPKLFVNDQYVRTDGQTIDRYIYWEKYDGVQPINCYEGQKAEWLTWEKYSKLPNVPTQVPILKKAFEVLT